MVRAVHSLMQAASGVARYWPAGQGDGTARRGDRQSSSMGESSPSCRPRQACNPNRSGMPAQVVQPFMLGQQCLLGVSGSCTNRLTGAGGVRGGPVLSVGAGDGRWR